MKLHSFFLLVIISVAGIMMLQACGDKFQEPIFPNTLTADINELTWVGDSSFTSAVVSENNGFVNILISSVNGSNEGIYLAISSRPEDVSGTHQVTSQANGTFIAYSKPGSTPGLESHNSFNCTSTNGTIIITEFDSKNKVITGEFTGNVCNQTGEQLKIANGFFYRLAY
ncbi:hypothetical protein R9C00_15905 [Flammeovirgaceae bacterium SG7u.111]|nr:hypothetical protein [Flammeovirgaceae bacterium SG7u.132]WPO33187.1 hypothetical protein R9C00_15905 [Flammeovirgaceae bacterium SG7u.111]